MPAFVIIPAAPDDLPDVARLQFEACWSDPPFRTIFPNGGTPAAIQHMVRQFEHDMEEDRTNYMMIARNAMSGEIASYAIWHFFPPKRAEDVESEMLQDQFPLPSDANVEAGNKLIHSGMRKRHEVASQNFGIGSPYAYLTAIGTSPKYQKQGAASMLLKWGIERADDYNLPIYLESTPVGLGLYLKHGFQEVDRLVIDTSPWIEGNFFNVCMVRNPNTG